MLRRSVMLDTMRLFPLVFILVVPVFAQQPLDRAWQVLNDGLHDANPMKRVQDVAAMGIMRPLPEVRRDCRIRIRRQGLQRSPGRVCRARADEEQAVHPKLRDALNDKAPEVVFAAAKALYEMGDPTGREVLVAVLLGDRADSSNFFSSSIHDMKAKMHDPKGLVLIGVKEGAGAFSGTGQHGSTGR